MKSLTFLTTGGRKKKLMIFGYFFKGGEVKNINTLESRFNVSRFSTSVNGILGGGA